MTQHQCSKLGKKSRSPYQANLCHRHGRCVVSLTCVGSDFSGWKKMHNLKENSTAPGSNCILACSDPSRCTTVKWRMLFSWHLLILLQATPLVSKKGQNQSLTLKASPRWLKRNVQMLPETRPVESAECILHRKDSLIYPYHPHK